MSWSDSVQIVGKWYENNIHQYSQSSWTNCPLPGCGKVRWDCSGYVSACLRHAGLYKSGYTSSSALMFPNQPGGKVLLQQGFRCIPYKFSDLKPYDILVRKGHVEIFAGVVKGSHRCWGWGSAHDKSHGKCMPWYMAYKKEGYAYIYRKDGVAGGPIDESMFDIPAGGGGPLTNSGISLGGGAGFGGGGGGNSSPFAYREQNPNYETVSSSVDTAVFTGAQDNAMSIAANIKYGDKEHTRIYSTNSNTITISELSVNLEETHLAT